MKKKSIEAEINNFLNYKGITITGIAGICALPRVPDDFSPKTILREAKSIICYGVVIPKGIIYANNNDLALYWRYCNMVYRSVDMVSNQLCLLLEEKSYFATPIYGCYPWKLVDHEFWGVLPLVYWAEQAGLGTLTKCGLLANPTHGSRILLGGVLTTLDLKPTQKVCDDLCPPDCLDCIEACPVNAINKMGKVDHNLCIRYSGANPLMALVLGDRNVKEKFSFETIVNTVGVDDHGSYLCLECLKSCPLNNR